MTTTNTAPPVPPSRRRNPVSGSRRAFSYPELMVATGIFAVLIVTMVSIMLTSSAAVDSTRAQVHADQDASLAMQGIIGDLREASRVAIYQGNTRVAAGDPGSTMLVIRPRIVHASGYYDRFQPDSTNPIRYYLSDESGDPTRAGAVLWKRQEKTGAARLLRRGVRELRFVERSSGRVEVSVVVEAKTQRGAKRTELTQRVVYMRNKK